MGDPKYVGGRERVGGYIWLDKSFSAIRAKSIPFGGENGRKSEGVKEGRKLE